MPSRIASLSRTATATVTLLAAGLAAGCSSEDKSREIAETVYSQDEFTLNEIFDQPVKEGYVFCEYTNADEGAELGFDPDDFYGIDNVPYAWEVMTGIGVIFQDGTREPLVEWFSPTGINACAKIAPYTRIEPDQTIAVGSTIKKFSDVGEKEIATLSIQK